MPGSIFGPEPPAVDSTCKFSLQPKSKRNLIAMATLPSSTQDQGVVVVNSDRNSP